MRSEGGGGSRGAGPCEGPGASRRSNAMPVVGHRILLPLRTPQSTETSLEQNRNIYNSCEIEVNPQEFNIFAGTRRWRWARELPHCGFLAETGQYRPGRVGTARMAIARPNNQL